MRTPRRWAVIPAGMLVVAALTACSSDDGDDSSASSAASSSVAGASSTSGATATAGPSSSGPATTLGTLPSETSDIPLPPYDTSDIPLPPQVSSDLPVTPAEPVFITVVVGADDSPQRVEDAPLHASVTIDVIDPDASNEYHLQGYELGAGEIHGPGETATLMFTADIPGDFILESVTTGQVLMTLHVA